MMKSKNSLAFFRKQFQVPQRVKLQWCILVESPSLPTKEYLGVLVVGTNKAIHVPQRRFVQVDGQDQPKAYPAKKTANQKNLVFCSEDGSKKLSIPKHYISDIYFRSVYSQKLIDQFLI